PLSRCVEHVPDAGRFSSALQLASQESFRPVRHRDRTGILCRTCRCPDGNREVILEFAMKLAARIPPGPIEQKWEKARFEMKLVNPANKRKYNVIIVGTGLAGGSAAATLGELGYNIKAFCYQDSPRRAHSIAAQGGINAAKNYQNDGDSVYRLFYDTVKGGDFRAREANVYRLAELSGNIIDQCVAQGV